MLTLSIVLIAAGCNKDKDNALDSQFTAEIVAFDLNCSTCILKFPDDSLTIKREIGASENNYYHAINLDKDTLKIGEKLKVKLRKANDQELSACITLYPDFNFKNIFITEYRQEE